MAHRRYPPNLLHASRRKTEQAIIAKLASGTPLASAPPEARSILAGSARMKFGDRRFTFMQLVKHAITIPEFAWWAADPRGVALFYLIPVPADDAGAYRPERVVADTEETIAEMAVDALRQSGLWAVEIAVFETDNMPHIVFAPTTRGSQ